MKVKKQTIFLTVYALYIFTMVLLESQFENYGSVGTIISALRYVLLAAIALYIICNNSTIQGRRIGRRIISFVFILTIAVLNLLLFNSGTTILAIILCVIASRGCSLKKIFSVTAISLAAGHLFVILSCMVGVLSDNIYTRYVGTLTGAFFEGRYDRHTLGFLVHNQPSLAFMIIYMYYIILKGSNIRLIEHAIAFAINLYLFRMCGARIVFALVIPLLIFTYLIQIRERSKHIVEKNKQKKGFSGWLVCLVPLVCCIVSFVTTLGYQSNSSFYSTLNEMVSNRLYYAQKNIEYFGISLFGAGKEAGTTEALLTVDNGYIILFLQNGLILGCIVVACWMYMGYITQKNGNLYLVLITVFLSIESMINSHLINYKMIPMFCMLVNTNDPLLCGNEVIRYKVHDMQMRLRKPRWTRIIMTKK